VKTVSRKFGNDQFFDMKNFAEMSRRIQWSKNEFSHSLSPEPTPIGRRSSAVAVNIADTARLSFFRWRLREGHVKNSPGDATSSAKLQEY
jgi:hypothetical protein